MPAELERTDAPPRVPGTIDFTEVDAPDTPDTPDDGTPAPGSVAAPADVPAPDAPAAPAAPSYAALDARIPVADDIDEEFRDKPLSEILRVAKQHKEEAKLGYTARKEVNDQRSRADMAEGMLRVLRERQATPPVPAEPPDPQLEASRRFVQSQVQPIVQPIQEELERLRGESYSARAENARLAARPASIDADTWNEVARPIASIIHANGGDPTDKSTWNSAFEAYKAPLAKLAPRQAPAPAPAAPPAGQARSTPTARSAPRLSARNEKNLEEMAGMFKIKRGTPAWDQLVKDIQNDPRAMGAEYE